MHERLDDANVKQLTESAESGKNAKSLHDAVSRMPFEDQHEALMQIQKQNDKNREADPSVRALTVDLQLDNAEKSETVSLRRSCDAWGNKGETHYSYTHNFGANKVDVSQWSGGSILCPGRTESSVDGTKSGAGGGGGSLETPDQNGPEWGGKSRSGGGGGGEIKIDCKNKSL